MRRTGRSRPPGMLCSSEEPRQDAGVDLQAAPQPRGRPIRMGTGAEALGESSQTILFEPKTRSVPEVPAPPIRASSGRGGMIGTAPRPSRDDEVNSMPPPEPRYRLPLFPLPIVLLPGARMPLHIFEPRYRALVSHCLENDAPFGMVYHDWDEQGPFLSEEGHIGCVAEIREHESLVDGRSLIVVEGMERFRIDDGIESEAPYFEALVSPYRDAVPPEGDELASRRRASIRLFRSVVASLSEPPEHLPDLAAEGEVSFLLAQTIRVEPTWHQGLLELQDEAARLSRLDRVFRAALG